MKTGVFGVAATRFQPLDIASLELSGSDENSKRSKKSGVGALEIEMSVPCRYSFRQ